MNHLKGNIESTNIYNPNAAFATFSFNNTYVDGFQLVRTNNHWRSINETFVNKQAAINQAFW